MSFDFANAATSFSQRRVRPPDGAFWTAWAIRAGLQGRIVPAPYDQRMWQWDRTSTSLGLAMRYSTLTLQQRAVHNAHAASDACPRELRDLMPLETRMAIAAWNARMNGPVATEPWKRPRRS